VSVAYRNSAGFLRAHADGSELRRYHVRQKFQRSDRERTALLKGEQSLIRLEIILDLVLENEDARIRAKDCLYFAFRAIGVERYTLGMPRILAAE
jgi:hypothetical protein